MAIRGLHTHTHTCTPQLLARSNAITQKACCGVSQGGQRAFCEKRCGTPNSGTPSPEPHDLLPVASPVLELLGRHKIDHLQVVGRGLQVLAERQNVHAHSLQQHEVQHSQANLFDLAICLTGGWRWSAADAGPGSECPRPWPVGRERDQP